MATRDIPRWQPRVSARLSYVALAIGTIGLGLFVYLGGSALPATTRDVLGDALWAIMIVWGISVFAPVAPRVARGAVALAVCWAVEGSQLYHSPAMDALRTRTAGRLVLGSGFDPRDLMAYAAGVIVAVLLDAALFRRSG